MGQKDPEEYGKFLKDHGFEQEEESETKQKKTGGPKGNDKMYEAAHRHIYYNFRLGGGIGYGPRYRICTIGGGNHNDQSVAIIQLQDCHEDWEREILLCAPLLDSGFHCSMAGNVGRGLAGVEV